MILAILFFIAFSCGVFFVPNWIWLAAISGFDLLLWLIFAKHIPKMLKNALKMSIFAILIFLLNLIFYDVISSLIIAWKLMIVCCFVLVFGKAFSKTQIAAGFSQLFYPLKIFKVDTEALSLTVTLALSFLPVLAASARALTKSLKARGFKLNLRSAFSQPHIILMVFFSDIFRRIDTIELTFRSRGYSK